MNANPSGTKAWLQERFQPVILVAATPAVEAACQSKNGLSIIDILRPFGSMQQLNVPLRLGDTSLRVQDLKLRFHGFASLAQPKPEVIDEHLKEVLSTSAGKNYTPEPFPNLLQSIQSGSTPDVTPWYTEYRDEFLRVLSFSEHESIDHPVGCVYVIPSDVAEPLRHMEALIQQTPAPALMEKDVMVPVRDKEFPKHYILLHDGYVGGEAAWKKAQDNLELMDACYGANHCTLLRINTGKGDKASMGAPPELFTSFRKPCLPGGGAGEPETRPAEPPQGLGAFLTTADLETVAQFVRDFTTKTLLPKLEERINRLNNGITATRRGIRNRLTRLWKGGSEGAIMDGPYPHHSIESQMRQLGDLGFLLRQYDFAGSMYRLAAADYLAQHNYKWYAGVEEMIGLCSALDPSQEAADPGKYFTRAYENYIKSPGRVNRMLATRAMILSAAYQMSAGRFLGANIVLMRAHYDEENARAALLLEQAAYALLHMRSTSIRKFAFHMVLAGLRYHSCQRRLSVNAYRQVLGVYQGHHWQYIEEHLNDLLGKMLRDQEPEPCALHFFALLGCTYRTAQLQQHYLNQFLDSLKAIDPAKQVPQQVAKMLQVPAVTTSEVRVIFSDQRCYGNAPAAALPEDAWVQLEASIAGPQDTPGPNWLSTAISKQSVDHEEYNTSVAGEDICIDVEFRNPLQVKLKVSKVQLLCEFFPNDASTPGKPPESIPSSPTSAPSRVSPDQVTLSSDDFTLHPGEALVEQLRATPLTPGWLRVTGARWLLNDAVPGVAVFDVKGRRRKRPKGVRPGQQKHYPPHHRLLFSIIPNVPRLEVQADAMPSTLYQGEMARVLVTLKNTGKQPLRNIQLLTDSPDVAARPCTAPEDSQPSTSGRGDLEPSSVLTSSGGNSTVYVYKGGKEGGELVAGARQQWEVWLHPQVQGNLEYKVVWYYEPQVPGSQQVRYRTLRMSHPVEVLPLLRVAPTVTPSAKDLYRYLLRMDVTCFKDREAVQVRQLSCSTGGQDVGWRLSHLNRATVADDTERPCFHSICPAISVSPGEASSIFFNLAPPACSQPAEEAGAAPSMPYDPYSGPIHRFHSSPQASTSTPSSASSLADPPVDVLLIWQIPNSRQAGGPASALRFGVVPLRDCCKAQESTPLRLMLQGQPVVSHNFRKQAMCAAPLELSVRNCSCREAAITVEAGPGKAGPELTAGAWQANPAPAAPGPLGVPYGGIQGGSPPSTPTTPQSGTSLDVSAPTLAGAGVAAAPSTAGAALLAGLPPSNDYLWGGRTRVTVPSIAPGSIATVPLRVCVFRPGTYMVSDYRCTAVFAPAPDAAAAGPGGSSTAKGGPYMLKVEA